MLKRTSLLLLVLTIIFSCAKNDASDDLDSLTLVDQFTLDIPEPSGLSFSSRGTSLYTVSDQTGKIYKISFTGELISTIDFTGTDLEGITVDPKNGNIWVVEERSRKLIQLSPTGNLLDSYTINVEQNEMNSGLEGITINPGNEHFYLLNEKIPGKLIETNKNGVKIRDMNLNFASDYSGIFYDDENNILWVLSDEDKTINQCELDGTLIKSYRIPISSAEGIAVRPIERNIYIVSDAREKLYVFSYE